MSPSISKSLIISIWTYKTLRNPTRLFGFGHLQFTLDGSVSITSIASFVSLPPKLSTTTNCKRSSCNPHIPNAFRTGYPSLALAHQPICCSDSTSHSQSHSSSTGVFIKGLSQSTAEGRLKKVFSQFGEVKRVNVVRDRVSNQSLGSAFVWFHKEESAYLAVKEMDGKVCSG